MKCINITSDYIALQPRVYFTGEENHVRKGINRVQDTKGQNQLIFKTNI